MFTIFIDDVDDYAPLIDLLAKFADDTKGLQEISSVADGDKLQNTLDSLTTWAEDWGMQFNTAKCKIMHAGRNNARQTRFTADPLNIVRSRLNIRKHSYAVRIVEDWNKLSHNVKTSRTVPAFKNAISHTALIQEDRRKAQNADQQATTLRWLTAS